MSRRRQEGLRTLVAQEAARILAEQGIRDFRVAKKKAAERLGLSDTRSLPNNTEIEAALSQHQRLFQGEVHEDHLREKREIAQRAMRMLERFEPRLVGPVLVGTVALDGEVNIHLFAETPEEVAVELMELRIPYDSSERRLRLADGSHARYPVFRFFAGQQQVDLTVFSNRAGRPPLSPVDGKPMRRARLIEVDALLEG